MRHFPIFLTAWLFPAALLAEEAIEPAINSRHYRIAFDSRGPGIARLSLDSLGGGRLDLNLLRPAEPGGERWRIKPSPRGIRYIAPGRPEDSPASWEFILDEKTIRIRSRFVEGAPGEALVLMFDPAACHTTLLGRMPKAGAVALPCILHCPDHGTVRITSGRKDAEIGFDARRWIAKPIVKVSFPAASAAWPEVEYTLEVVAIHPDHPGIAANRRYDAFRRNFLNIFQLNPRLRVLANNVASDPVSFTVYKYAEVAAVAPPLADGLTCMDLVRATLDRYLAGMKGYGQVGYLRNMEGADTLEWSSKADSLDALPSLLIASCVYVNATRDRAWAAANYPALRRWCEEMLARDADGNGLIEHPASGNSGSWSGKADVRPANWWDTVGFGHEDAYSNALAYRACVMMAELARNVDQPENAAAFAKAAARLKAAYKRAFFNPRTGLLAGWKSADGQLHDYAFTFVNAIGVCYDLLDREDADAVMTTLLRKMREVGFTNFRLGLPGNLVPIRKADYVDLKPRWGGPAKEDGSDGFQIYENGGATHCYAYFTVKALYKLGRVEEARAIYYPLLEAMAAGEFQGKGANGNSRDWKNWKGECFGYEGFLCDGYLALLAVEDDLKATGR